MNAVSIVISVVALLLSGISIYFQFFYKRDAISCTPVGFNVETSRVTLQLVIGNAGTRPIMLKDARLLLQFKTKTMGSIFHDDVNHRNLLEPMLIPENELRSVVLTLPINDSMKHCISNWHDSGLVIDSDGSWPVRAHLNFVTVSGKVIVSEEIVFTIKWRQDGYSSSMREDAWQIDSWKFERFLKRLIADINS